MNTFTDPRDGEVYKTVKIGNRIWLAENLRYRGPVKRFNDWTIEEKGFYYSPNGESKNIKEYGCLYTWDNAFKACPKDWHLPTKEDFNKLLTCMSRSTTWNRGLDLYGFSAMPVGSCYGGGSFVNFGKEACFWSLTPKDKYNAYSLCLTDSVGWITSTDPNCCLSVRCIKD